MKVKNINALMNDVKKDIIRYGEDKKVLIKIMECEDESILYQYEDSEYIDKYVIPREENDGWTYYAATLGYLDMCLRAEKASRKEKYNIVAS